MGLTNSPCAAACFSISASRAASRACSAAIQSVQRPRTPRGRSPSCSRNRATSPMAAMSGRRFRRASLRLRLAAISVAERRICRP